MLRISKSAAIFCSESMSTFPTLTLPSYSWANSSTIGATIRQGPHQLAQKSTNTGTEDSITSDWKLSSVRVIAFPNLFTAFRFVMEFIFNTHCLENTNAKPVLLCMFA